MKLTVEEMNGIFAEAWLQSAKNPQARYRFGQAVWNLVPSEVNDIPSGSELDFFYWSDYRSNEITQICMDHFVAI